MSLTLNDWVTSSGKYADRAKSDELTDEVKTSAQKLLNQVNSLLEEIEITGVKVSSGFRPSSVNAAIPNAAKKSAHMTGLAIDLEDGDGEIDKKLSTDEGQLLLEKYGLWQEHPSKTIGWMHCDSRKREDIKRPGCAKRQFMP